ncbi:MAG: hypothetical protein LKH27_08060 [Prevotella sp.]|jgi:hypothetical protein|nr:hypothetical protein [Prevotella sp.]MCH3993048.1 hypothetical protein [Prevotella sp.]MCI1474351.1 hypothetical protein [Prevotella sp.]MCI1596093.1 hypothetical protein [Prevotella sp.]HAT61547.1 hypothetical protein [Prevotella sp.]
MPSLADLISPLSRKDLLSTIQPGDIFRIRLTIEEGITPKNKDDSSRNKYFIVIGKTKDKKVIGFVVINSCINQNLSIQLQQLHYPLRAAKYFFLDHDSYVCCGELKEITIEHFSDRYTCQSFGSIDKDDLKYITDAVISSPIESPKHLRKFGLI